MEQIYYRNKSLHKTQNLLNNIKNSRTVKIHGLFYSIMAKLVYG